MDGQWRAQDQGSEGHGSLGHPKDSCPSQCPSSTVLHDVSPSIVEHSFYRTGLSNALDGAEDDALLEAVTVAVIKAQSWTSRPAIWTRPLPDWIGQKYLQINIVCSCYHT